MEKSLSVDEAEKKAIDYLQKKFNPKSIKVTSAGYVAPNEVVVKGDLKDQDDAAKTFQVTVSTLSGEIHDWKLGVV